MKFRKVYMVLFASLAACSSPRYTYYFPQAAAAPIVPMPIVDLDISFPEANSYTASTQLDPALQPKAVSPPKVIQKGVTEASETVARIKPNQKDDDAPAESAKPNNDGKLGIIFFVAGVVIYIIGSPVFNVLGALSMMIGVIFGIKWLLRK